MAGKYSSKNQRPEESSINMPSNRSDVSEISSNNSGTSTKVKQNRQEIENKIGDLTYELFETETERKNTNAYYYGTQTEIDKLQTRLDAIKAKSFDAPQIRELEKQIAEKQSTLEKTKKAYDELKNKTDKLEKQIMELDAGLNTNNPVQWENK